MARSRFRPAERVWLVEGAEIEWRNGGVWHPGVLTGSPVEDSIGCWYVPLIHTGRSTRTVTNGDVLRGYPNFVRQPVLT